MFGSGPALAPFRLAGMYDAHVCAVAVGGGAITVEAECLHRRVAHGCTCFTRDVPHIACFSSDVPLTRIVRDSRVVCACLCVMFRTSHNPVCHSGKHDSIMSDVSHRLVQNGRTSFAPPFDENCSIINFHSAYRSFAPPFGGTSGTMVGRFLWSETHRLTVCIWWGVSSVWSLKCAPQHM
jgi:hypothetical protein